MRTTIVLTTLFIAAGCASSPQAPAPEAAAPVAKAESAPAAKTDTAAPAAKTDAAAPAQQAANKATGGGSGVVNKDGKVCRTESVTNTRLKTRKVCLTPEEWTARSETAQDAWRETAKSPMHPRLDSGG